MGLGTHALRLPRKEDAHFLSLIGGGAVLMTVFFLFISTASEQAQYEESSAVPDSPAWRRSSLEAQHSKSSKNTHSYVLGTVTGHKTSSGRGTLAAVHEKTLVVYLYSHTDPVYQNNINYFISHGISANDGCDYIFVLQGADSPQVSSTLLRLPSNARYFYTQRPDCEMGLGMVSDVFSSGAAKKEDYRYFVFLTSSVRGPFIPTYAMDDKHWTHYFTQKLTEKVKLVGPTISCESRRGPGGEEEVVAPHVQFTAVATDQIGLGVMEADGKVLQCHNSSAEEHELGEMGASAAILRANYTLDTFMTRYRRVDWSNRKNWKCNQQKEPLPEFNYDGSSVHPYETMFVPMDTVAIENGWSFAKLAALYETWLTLQDQGDIEVESNAWVSDPWPIKRQRIAYMQSRGPGCFDNHYYLQKNPDLIVIPTVLELWDHFVMMGQFEGRSFRWSCEDDRKLPWE